MARPQQILLRHHRMPGDILAMTPLIRAIQKQYPKKFEIYVETPMCPEIWDNNPHKIAYGWPLKKGNLKVYQLDYKKAVDGPFFGLHHSYGFKYDFEDQTGISLSPFDIRPQIFLSKQEKLIFEESNKDLIESKYWVICPGNKNSNLLKNWPESYWRSLIALSEVANNNIDYVEVGKARHNNCKLYSNESIVPNYINAVNETEQIRKLFCLIYYSQGTIGYPSLHMHIAAAFNKPSIIMAGGREDVHFMQYPGHQILSTIGSLPCCGECGCRKAAKNLGKKNEKKEVKDLCLYYKNIDETDYPLCMLGIKPNQVLDKLLLYHKSDNIKMVCQETRQTTLENEIVASSQKEHTMQYPNKGNDIVSIKNDNCECSDIFCHGDGYVKPEKPIFRMFTTCHAYGGGERTAIEIMKLMYNAGYDIHLVTFSICKKFSKALKALDFDITVTEFDIGKLTQDSKNNPFHWECDIFFLHLNDLLLRRNFNSLYREIRARKKIISINYTTQNIYGQGLDDWDLYICQAQFLADELLKEGISQTKIRILPPPTNLKKFLEQAYYRDYSKLRLIRYSSQGDRKYNDNINQMVTRLFEIRPDIEIHLMPAPSFLYDRRVNYYDYNIMSPWLFLHLGNLFWYDVPTQKYKEIGANCCREAMAAGLPLLANYNGGIQSIGNEHINNFYEEHQEKELYSIIQNVTLKELKERGDAARQWIIDNHKPQKWVETIREEL